MIEYINNNEGGGDVRAKLNEVIDEANKVPDKVDKIPTATAGNVAIFGSNGVILDSGKTLSGSESANIPTWDDIQFIPVPIDYTVQYNGRLFSSKINDNLNNQPPLEGENDYWIEVSESTGNGFGNYSPGIYSADPSLVINADKLYLLNSGTQAEQDLDPSVVVLPFNSIDFAAELAAGIWILQSGQVVIASNADMDVGNDDAKAVSPLKFVYGVTTRIFSGFNTVAKTIQGAINHFQLMIELLKEPTGFRYPEQMTVTYDGVNRTVTLTGNVEAYYRGRMVTELVDGWVSAAHGAGSGQFFLYYDGTNFIWANSPWSFDVVMIAMAYRDGSNFCLRECHGLMQWQAHEEFHNTIGTYLHTGGAMTGFTLNSTLASERRPLISSAIIKDEDLPTTLLNTTVELYSQLYLSNNVVTNYANIVTDQPDILPLSGNQPYYNQFNGSIWVQTLFPNNAYGKVFLMAIPVTADADCQKKRFIFIQPQQVSTTLATIQAVSPSSIDLGHIQGSLSEYVFIGEVIIRYASNNWTWIEAKRLVGTKLIQAAIQGGGGGGSNIAADIILDTATFNNNLDGTVTDVQLLAEKVDELKINAESIAFNTVLPFTRNLTLMAGKTLTTNDVFTAAANPIEGGAVQLYLIGNGVNVPDFSAFNHQSGAYDKTNGVRNVIGVEYSTTMGGYTVYISNQTSI